MYNPKRIKNKKQSEVSFINSSFIIIDKYKSDTEKKKAEHIKEIIKQIIKEKKSI